MCYSEEDSNINKCTVGSRMDTSGIDQQQQTDVSSSLISTRRSTVILTYCVDGLNSSLSSAFRCCGAVMKERGWGWPINSGLICDKPMSNIGLHFQLCNGFTFSRYRSCEESKSADETNLDDRHRINKERIWRKVMWSKNSKDERFSEWLFVILLPEFSYGVMCAWRAGVRVSIRIVELRSSSLFRHHQSPKRLLLNPGWWSHSIISSDWCSQPYLFANARPYITHQMPQASPYHSQAHMGTLTVS